MGGISRGILTGEENAIGTAKRQAKFKKTMTDAGYVQLNAWVPADQAADLKEMCAVLRKDDDLAVGPCVRKSTGRLTSWRNYEEE